jgi:hypothetical protein
MSESGPSTTLAIANAEKPNPSVQKDRPKWLTALPRDENNNPIKPSESSTIIAGVSINAAKRQQQGVIGEPQPMDSHFDSDKPNLTFEIGKRPEERSNFDKIDDYMREVKRVRESGGDITKIPRPNPPKSADSSPVLRGEIHRPVRLEDMSQSMRDLFEKKGAPPSYSTAPWEGSRANTNDGVGDLPPGPKTGEYNGPLPQPEVRKYPGFAPDTIDSPAGRNGNGSDVSGAFYPEGLREKQTSESGNLSGEGIKAPENPEEKIVERGKRLLGVVGKALGERARRVVESIPASRLKLDKDSSMALLALAGLALVLLSQGERKVSAPSGPAKLPTNEYERQVYEPVLGPAPVPWVEAPPPAPVGVQDPEGGVTTPERSRAPGVEPVKFPNNVSNRSLDGYIKKKIVELDPEFQARLKERGADSAAVGEQDPDFQAALLRTTVAMGGDSELNAVVRKEGAALSREIQDLNPGRIIFDRKDSNKIVGNDFDAPRITQERIDKDREEIRQERQGEARQAVAYIRDVVDASSDPDVVKLLEDVENGSAQMRLAYSQGEVGKGYVYSTYEIGGESGHPTLKYILHGEPGKMIQSAEYRKDETGKFGSLNIDDIKLGGTEDEHKAILVAEFPGSDPDKFESAMGRYENGGFGRSLYGEWTRPSDGKIFMVTVDAVGRRSVSEKP